jgi:hypothetical protein
MKKPDLEVRMSTDVTKENHPCAKAMGDILENFMERVGKHIQNDATRLSDIPPQALIVMMVNNIFLNMFLKCYDGDDATLLNAADEISDKVKAIFMDCIQKVVAAQADENIKN